MGPGLRRSLPWVLTGVAAIFASIIVIFLGIDWYRSTHRPDHFARDFIGFASIDGMRPHAPGESCRMTATLQDWISLSEGFSLADTPHSGRRYVLYGAPGGCGLLKGRVASGSGEPVLIQAGQAGGGGWYLMEVLEP